MNVSAAADVVTWADELTAYGTVGAVLVSLLLAIFGAVVALREKRSQSRRDRRNAERAQAEHFHWWHELCTTHPLPYEEESSLRDAYRALGLHKCWGEVLIVENTSDAPVHDVVLHTPRYLIPRLTSFIPGEVGPHSRRVFHIAGFGASLLDPQFSPAGTAFFSDAQGRRWQREKSGRLVRSSASVEDDEKLAEKAQRQLFHTLRDIGDEEQWTDPANKFLRDVWKWIAIAPEDGSPARRRHMSQQLRRADSFAFRLLQRLPSNHYERRKAQLWWQWRSGKVSLDELIHGGEVFYPTEVRMIDRSRRAKRSS